MDKNKDIKFPERNPEINRLLWESLRLSELYQRIGILRRKGFYIESFSLSSQIIEYLIKESIRTCIDFIRLSLKEESIVSASLFNKKNNLTLGGLVDVLKTYIKDDILIRELEQFKNFRNTAIHKLFDINRSLDEIQGEIAAYIDKDNEFRLIRKLQKLISIIHLERIEMLMIRKGIPDKKIKAFREDYIKMMNKPPPKMKENDIS